jgi:NAD(P)-dependent dehydrogenase (short-subunit alcohol dehydrogenase family)
MTIHMYNFLGFAAGTPIVVTGAGSGIGEAIALTAGKLGLRVSAWDLAEAGAVRTAEAIAAAGGKARALRVDAADRKAVVEAWRQTTAEFGAVGCFAAVAGPPSFAGREFADGVTTAIDCVRIPTEVWLEQPNAEARAAVYLSSVQGPRYGAGVPWYTVAKSAIDGYMRSLAGMRTGGIRANAILPDWIYTPRTEKYVNQMGGLQWEANPMGRVGVAQDVANVALFLLSPAAEYLNGLSIEVDGGSKLRSLGWMRMHEVSGSGPKSVS